MASSSRSSPSSPERSDTSVVVLTMGEPETDRALASIRSQTSTPAEVIVIEGVSPLSRALSEGASRVRTEFFVQVDSDMVLYDDCIESLRAAIGDGVGLVVGLLLDPMRGRTPGVKLYRTSCFLEVGYPETPSPDTDFGLRLHQNGWTNVRLIRCAGPREQWHVFGEHRPEYSPAYAFRKHVEEGRRHPYRGDARGVRWILRALAASDHPMATISAIAFAHGTLDEGDPARSEAELAALREFLAAEGPRHRPAPLAAVAAIVSLRPAWIYATCLRHAIRCRRAGAHRAFDRSWRLLTETRHPYAWLAAVGLAQGLFTEDSSRARVRRDMATLAALVRTSRPGGVLREQAGRIVARGRAAVRRRRARGRPTAPRFRSPH